jgi:hypothetical protein
MESGIIFIGKNSAVRNGLKVKKPAGRGILCTDIRVFFMPWDHQVFETPVTDATGNFFHRRIEHHPDHAIAITLAAIALPLLAVIPLTAKNMFSLNADPNHFGPLVIF